MDIQKLDEAIEQHNKINYSNDVLKKIALLNEKEDKIGRIYIAHPTNTNTLSVELDLQQYEVDSNLKIKNEVNKILFEETQRFIMMLELRIKKLKETQETQFKNL